MKLKQFLNEKDIMSANEIYTKEELILKKLDFPKFKKLEDGSFEIWGTFDGHPKNIAIKIKIFHGNFNCSNRGLNFLFNCPEIVDGNFYCYSNNLKTLQGSPKKVYENFVCFNNKLISLEGSPKEVFGYYECYENTKKFTKEEVESVCKVWGEIGV